MIIVTGGAGFIGSACVRMLNDEGIDDILIVDDLGHGEKWKNLRGKRISDYLHKEAFIERVSTGKEFDAVTAVIHMGACSSTTETDAEYMLENNYHYSRVLAEWCLRNRIRFIYASSAATYGDGSMGFSDNDSGVPSLKPLNVYGYSKQLFDSWALNSGAFERVVGLKFFNVFGPNEYHKGDMRSVICKTFDDVKNDRGVRLFKSYRDDFGDGEQKRDFVYVKDCVKVIAYLLQEPHVCGLFNLGSGTARSWNDVARAMFTSLGKAEKIEYIDMPETLRPKYQYFTEAKMEKLIGSRAPVPTTSLEDAIDDYIQNHLLKEDPVW